MSFISFLENAVSQFNRLNEVVSDIRSLLGNEPSVSQPVTQSTLNTATNNNTAAQVVKSSDTSGASKERTVDETERLQLDPDTNNKIPVLYGRAVISGKIVDAYEYDVLAVDGRTRSVLSLVLSLAMITGNKINGDPTEYTLHDVYIDNQRVTFANGGQVVQSVTDDAGETNTEWNSHILVKLYAESDNNIMHILHPDGVVADARNYIPDWGPNHKMTGQLFAVVLVAYYPEVGLTKIPTFQFDIESSMNLPGDVLYDYMTNTVYGCGIDPSMIKATSL